MIIIKIKGHLGVKTKMTVIGHIEFLTFDRIALESYVVPHFGPIWMHWLQWYGYFYESRSSGQSKGQNKMAALGHLEFSCFDIIALESHVLPHFWLIWMQWFHWHDYYYDLRSSRGQNQDGCHQPYLFDYHDYICDWICNSYWLINIDWMNWWRWGKRE